MSSEVLKDLRDTIVYLRKRAGLSIEAVVSIDVPRSYAALVAADLESLGTHIEVAESGDEMLLEFPRQGRASLHVA